MRIAQPVEGVSRRGRDIVAGLLDGVVGDFELGPEFVLFGDRRVEFGFLLTHCILGRGELALHFFLLGLEVSQLSA
jgi:hypothetical protein